jgi:hypothetical protein
MPLSVEIVCVDPKYVHQIWPHAKEFIHTAVARTGLAKFELVEKDVLEGAQLLWIAWDNKIQGAATSRLADNGMRKVCEITACGGDRNRSDEWLHILGPIEKYAKDEACSSMRVIGRKGWERVLKTYHPEYIILEKSL